MIYILGQKKEKAIINICENSFLIRGYDINIIFYDDVATWKNQFYGGFISSSQDLMDKKK